MHKIILMLFCLTPVALHAQRHLLLEPAQLECQYAIREQWDTLSRNQWREDPGVLRVGKKYSEFLNWKGVYRDSLQCTPNGQNEWGRMMVQAIRSRQYNSMPLPRTSFTQYFYKNYPAGKLTITDYIGMTYYQYEDKYKPQNWQLLDSTKTVLGYHCQKAECDFAGRHYIAWFTQEIPVSEGPWKFNGLPGLILDVYDSRQIYRFTATGIKTHDLSPVYFYQYRKTKKINIRNFKKGKRNEDAISNAEMENAGVMMHSGKNNYPHHPLNIELE